MSDSTSNTRKFVASALGHVGTQNKHVNSSGDAGLQDYQWFFWPPRFPDARFDAFATHLCLGWKKQPEEPHPRPANLLTRDPDMAKVVSQLKDWQSKHAQPPSPEAQEFVHDGLEIRIRSCTKEVERVTKYGTEFDFESKTEISVVRSDMSGPINSRPGGLWIAQPMRMLVAEKSSTGEYEISSRELGSEDELKQILHESDSGIVLARWRVRAATGSNSDKDSDTTPLVIQPNLNSADGPLFLTIDEVDKTKLVLKKVKTEDVNLDTSHQWMLTPYTLSLVSS